jgi:hypothetical protein
VVGLWIFEVERLDLYEWNWGKNGTKFINAIRNLEQVSNSIQFVSNTPNLSAG